jgi:signal transduction histidine kinase
LKVGCIDSATGWKESHKLVHPLHKAPVRISAFSSDFHTLSHDLRTPLNHINGFAELLLLGGDLDSNQVSYVEAILRASNALQATVLAYLDRAQSE